jgi:hypothetical protein
MFTIVTSVLKQQRTHKQRDEMYYETDIPLQYSIGKSRLTMIEILQLYLLMDCCVVVVPLSYAAAE